jgi:hypothetical protein
MIHLRYDSVTTVDKEGGGKGCEEKERTHLSQRENNRYGGGRFQYYLNNFADLLINRMKLCSCKTFWTAVA